MITDYRTKAERDAAKRFASETAGHKMTVLHDEGLYRHLRFTAPDNSGYRFDLITWPNKLTFTGEPGTYAFSVYPTEDMFDLFRRSSVGDQPNFSYWHEKAMAWGEDIVQFSNGLFDEKVAEELKQAEEFFPGVTAAWREKTEGFLAEFSAESMEAARDSLANFEYLPEDQYGEAWRFRYTNEWDLNDYDWRYLFACHAIADGIAQYDAAKAAGAVAA
jgi:hypothetical protein